MVRTALLPLWICTVVAGFYALTSYEQTPSQSGQPCQSWPGDVGISVDPSVPTLIMFAHPHCPCTRASMGEFSILMAKCTGRVRAYVVFVRPAGTDDDWTHTDLRTKAENIPEVVVLEDLDGLYARQFQIHTSGETLLYDSSGELRFCGGITASRGHHGANSGRQSIASIILQGKSMSSTAPVFGCPLLDQPESTN